MKGAVKNYGQGEAMVRALLAGNDVLETFMDVPETVTSIKKAINNGLLPIELINLKVKKVLMAKSWVGLDHYQPISLENLVPDLNTNQADFINYQLTEKSITCLKNDFNLLPITQLEQKIAVINVEGDSISRFDKMTEQYTNADYYWIPKNTTAKVINSILSKVETYEIVIAAFHLIDIRSSKNYGLNAGNIKIVKTLATRKNSVICILGNPFILHKIPELDQAHTSIMAYQLSDYTQKITPQIIFGALPCQGVFPMDVTTQYKVGVGKSWDALGRLSYGIPEQLNIDRVYLQNGLDSIILSGIQQSAFPVGVVQVALDGKVVFHKAYGFHTYELANLNKEMQKQETGHVFSFIDDAMDNTKTSKQVDYFPVFITKEQNIEATFTDAILVENTIYFLAAAENSSSTYLDGEILGTWFGSMDLDTFQINQILKISNNQKFEGITLYKNLPNQKEFLLCEDNYTEKLESTIYKVTLL